MSKTNSTISKLNKLLSDKVLTPAEMDKHVKEITGKNHRLIAVVCGTMVESALAGKLKTLMPNLSGEAETEVFSGPNAPLGTFSSKIKIAKALGLVNQDIARNSDYIRTIRNAFAHHLKPINFNTPEVKAVCDLLLLGKHSHRKRLSASRKYMFAAVETVGAIHGRSRLK